jgi:GT2 family glycosyltransferase
MSAPAPAISVVVRTCGGLEALERCLDALAQQKPVAGGVEVVLSIDGPDLAPADVRAAGRGLALDVVQAARTGAAAARNGGAVRATGALLAFVDDDCAPQPSWAGALRAALDGHPEAIAGGPIVNADPRDATAAAAHAVLDALYACPTEEFVAAANLAIRRERFVALDGFDESFPTAAAEGRDLCARAVDAGMEVIFAPNATVVHHQPAGAGSLWRQHAEYGRARRLARQRAQAGRPPVRAGNTFPRELVHSTLRAARDAHSPAVVPLVGLAQVATAWGYATGRRRLGPLSRPA